MNLQSTRRHNGGALRVLDRTALRAGSLDGLDNCHAIIISNLAEDDVPTVEPRRDHGGDEELRAIPVWRERSESVS